MDFDNTIKSPCRDICKYDENKVCIGCYRSAEEIAKWWKYSNEEKLEVLEKIRERKAQNSGDYYGNFGF
jgi:predicted Fe-S protein YdhL (DUF1289 family)